MIFMNSFFPFLDIIILGLLALFLGFRLKNLLGDRSGYGEDVNKLESYNETKPDKIWFVDPDTAKMYNL